MGRGVCSCASVEMLATVGAVAAANGCVEIASTAAPASINLNIGIFILLMPRSGRGLRAARRSWDHGRGTGGKPAHSRANRPPNRYNRADALRLPDRRHRLLP